MTRTHHCPIIACACARCARVHASANPYAWPYACACKGVHVRGVGGAQLLQGLCALAQCRLAACALSDFSRKPTEPGSCGRNTKELDRLRDQQGRASPRSHKGGRAFGHAELCVGHEGGRRFPEPRASADAARHATGDGIPRVDGPRVDDGQYGRGYGQCCLDSVCTRPLLGLL